MLTAEPTVFLVDVDNTLLDNDGIQADLKCHLDREFGAACRNRYWAILEGLFDELGYRDYLGALQRYRAEHPEDINLLTMSSYLVDYPFADRLYPDALDVIERIRSCGRTVILSDGDVVFQPRKVERSGIFAAVEGHVLIYIHKEKELDDVERRYPAAHYVLIDDKPRCQDRLGRPRNHGAAAAGAVCQRGRCCQLPRSRPHDCADRRPSRLRFTGRLIAHNLPPPECPAEASANGEVPPRPAIPRGFERPMSPTQPATSIAT